MDKHTTRHQHMATFVPPEPRTIETQPQTIVVPPTVYIVVLGCIILIGLLSGAYLTMVSDWSRVAIGVTVAVATVVLLLVSQVILSGNLPAVLQYRAYDRHDIRLYKIKLLELRNESARISVPQLMDPARAAAVQWLRLMYTDHGPNYNEVRPSGQLINTAPWSSRSANQRDGLAMLRILEDAGLVSTDGQNPVLNIQACPTLDIALANLS